MAKNYTVLLHFFARTQTLGEARAVVPSNYVHLEWSRKGSYSNSPTRLIQESLVHTRCKCCGDTQRRRNETLPTVAM